jgi:hypothetical protein
MHKLQFLFTKDQCGNETCKMKFIFADFQKDINIKSVAIGCEQRLNSRVEFDAIRKGDSYTGCRFCKSTKLLLPWNTRIHSGEQQTFRVIHSMKMTVS